MKRRAAMLLSLLLLATACSRGGEKPSGEPPVVVPELPPAKVEVPADNVQSRLAISGLAMSPVASVPAAGKAVTPAHDAAWMKAKADLTKLLKQSPLTPAPGLQDALLAYYRRPDVAALPVAVADPKHTVRTNRTIGTKEESSPGSPVVIHAGPIYEGELVWRLSLVRWQVGEKIYAAPLPDTTAMTARSVTYQGRPAVLTFQFAAPESPLSVSAYMLGDNKLEPVKLSVPPAVAGVTPTAVASHQVEFRGGKASHRHPDFYWVCFGESCLTLDWSDATGLSLKPAGFGPAEAQKRLTDTDGNRVPVETVHLGKYIDQRLASPASLEEAHAALRERLGAAVWTARSGDAVARAVSFTNQAWLAGQGYQSAFGRIQFRGGGVSYANLPFDGGGYMDHRVLQDGGKVYLLLLTQTEPRPSNTNVLALYVAEGGKVHKAALPDKLSQGATWSFLSMDGRLLLRCPPISAELGACTPVRLDGGELVSLKPGTLGAEPSAEAKQARGKALAKFQAAAYPESAQFFRQAAEHAPLWVDAWNDLSFAYQKAGDWPSALTAANTALRLDPKSAAAHYNLGVSYLGHQDPESALSFLHKAAEMQPQSADVWLALGRAREQVHLRIAAAQAYEKALQLDPGNAEAAAGLKRVQALLPEK